MQTFSTATDLLPHQSAAVDKVLSIRVGALFMEMGTGKSRTAIELVRLRADKIRRVLWFCPVSLKDTIRQEIAKHAPGQSVHVFAAHTGCKGIPDADWYVIGIESMSCSRRVILAVNALVGPDDMVIVDESQYIKGHRAARTDWITRLAEPARYRLILTGTPISQGVQDLFSQMRFLSPQILGYRSWYSFAHNHLEYHPDYPDMIVRAHNTEWLAAKIRPYVYQVTKAECLDLPNKLYEARYFHMTQEQSRLYNAVKEDILSATMDAEDWDVYFIFRLFSALQQVACGFQYEGRAAVEVHNHRLETLLRVVEDVPAAEKVIIWTKYTHSIGVIAAALRESYGPGSVATFFGKLSERERTGQIDLFRARARFFVATPSCAGHGLTLNEASTAIFFDNGFKYAERIQAEDRCHRFGQTRPVTYVDLVCSDSIDERIMQSLSRKEDAVSSFKRDVDRIKKDKKGSIKELVESL